MVIDHREVVTSGCNTNWEDTFKGLGKFCLCIYIYKSSSNCTQDWAFKWVLYIKKSF